MDTPDSVCRPSICRARPLLGTFVEIRSAGASRSAAEQAVEAAFAAIAKVQRLMSFHDADSDVSRLNREAFNHSVVVDPWTYEVLETALALHRQSMGAFDIAVAPALQELGVLPSNEGERDVGRIERATSGAIELLPDNRVCFHHPATRIDLGGIAKGFAVTEQSTFCASNVNRMGWSMPAVIWPPLDRFQKRWRCATHAIRAIRSATLPSPTKRWHHRDACSIHSKPPTLWVRRPSIPQHRSRRPRSPEHRCGRRPAPSPMP
jgi:hypothetical protein